MDKPTVASLELGMKQLNVFDLSQEESFEQAMSDAQMQKEFMGDHRFNNLVKTIHELIHHGQFSFNCITQQAALTAIMVKMFWAGWIAGQQEVIDAEVKKIAGQ